MIPRPRKHFHLKDVFPVGESNPGPGGESLVSRPLGYQAPQNLPKAHKMQKNLFFSELKCQVCHIIPDDVTMWAYNFFQC